MGEQRRLVATVLHLGLFALGREHRASLDVST
jgi:hypothetical protein